MKKALSLILSLSLVLALASCGAPSTGGAASPPPATGTPSPPPETPAAATVELMVFAAASMTETMNQMIAQYQAVAPNVTVIPTFESSGTLKTQIEEGAECDLFISAAQKQMNQLDELKLVLADTRVDLLQNKVVLVTPEGNPAGVASFEDVGTDKVKLLALGGADVPVGQYSEEIFTAMGLWDGLNANQKITFTTNVKEVTAQVTEGAVDCGVVYATDAAGAGLTAVAEAPAGTHTPVIYPAALLNTTQHETEAKAFLDYLQSADGTAVFEAAGFSVPA